MTDEAAFDLDAALAEIRFPEDFTRAYDVLECLSSGRGVETFLVRKKGEAETRVAKCYDKRVYKAVREGEICGP